MTIRAPLIYNRPLPGPVQGFIQGRAGGPSGGKQFAGNGQWKSYDYPNPRGPQYPVSLLTWIDPLKVNLRLLDKQFAGPGQWKSYDYPNPRGPQRPIDLLTFINPMESQLIGKDTQFRTFGQWTTYDYPNPRSYQRPVDLLTWAVPGNALGAVQNPFRQTNWPNPRGYPPTDYTYLDSFFIGLIGKDTLPFRNDWVVPKGPAGTAVTWIQNLLQTTLSGIALPFNQGDWPIPLGARFPIDLRTWLSSVKLGLIGKDQFFFGAGRGPTYDYPNPRGYEFSVQLRTIAQGFTMLDAIPPAVIIIPPVVIPPVPPGGTSHKKRYRRLKKLKEYRIPDPKEVIVDLVEPVEHQTLMQVLKEMERAGFDLKEQEEEDDALVLTFILKTLQ